MSNVTTIQQLPKGQIIANIPKAIAEAIGLRKGDKIEWKITREGLYLHKKS